MIALVNAHATMTADELRARVADLASALKQLTPQVQVLGLQADNGFDWVVVDLAAQEAGIVLVPLPAFFTPTQVAHAVAESGMDALFTVAPDQAQTLGFGDAVTLPEVRLPLVRRELRGVFPSGSAKITYTSGTTGTPKGIRLDAKAQWAVAEALAKALCGVAIERHLCVLPLPVLLENVAGVYAPLVRGAACCVPPLREVGMTGASTFDPIACLAAIERYDANSVILLPQMLAALTAALAAGAKVPPCLRFAAVGGAKVSPDAILRARALGIPVYEGYGLSECASVVALNVPGADRPGSVGRPLSHARVRIAPDGEIMIEGHSLIATGDLGRIDAEGYLYVAGRRKQQLITSFGRNVAPEWPESELLAGGSIAQAIVFGESRPALCAVLVACSPLVADATLEAQVQAANARMPDYARIAAWIRADAPFHSGNGLATANGRAKRDAIYELYATRLAALYEEGSRAVF